MTPEASAIYLSSETYDAGWGRMLWPLGKRKQPPHCVTKQQGRHRKSCRLPAFNVKRK